MSESKTTGVDAVTSAWENVGKAANKASDLYLRELEAYLDWAKNVQKDFLAQYWRGVQQAAQVSGEQFALYQRLGTTFPTLGRVPKGTETISGMVESIVQQTERGA